MKNKPNWRKRENLEERSIKLKKWVERRKK